LTHENYAHRVNTYVTNQFIASSCISEDTVPPFGQSLYDKFKNLFYIEHEMTHLFEVQPNYYRYTEADETLIKLQRYQLPIDQWWHGMLEVLPR